MPMPTVRRYTQIADVNPKAGLPAVPVQWSVHPHICLLSGVATWVSPRAQDTTAYQAFADLSNQRPWRRWALNNYVRSQMAGKPIFLLPHNAADAALGVGLMSDGAALPNFAFLSNRYYVMMEIAVTAEHATDPAVLWSASASGPASHVVGIQRLSGGKLRVTHGAAFKETVNAVLPLGTISVVEVSFLGGTLSVYVNGVKVELAGGSTIAVPSGTVTSQGIGQSAGLAAPKATIHLGDLVVAQDPVDTQSPGDRAARLAAQAAYWGISIAV